MTIHTEDKCFNVKVGKRHVQEIHENKNYSCPIAGESIYTMEISK